MKCDRYKNCCFLPIQRNSICLRINRNVSVLFFSLQDFFVFKKRRVDSIESHQYFYFCLRKKNCRKTCCVQRDRLIDAKICDYLQMPCWKRIQRMKTIDAAMTMNLKHEIRSNQLRTIMWNHMKWYPDRMASSELARFIIIFRLLVCRWINCPATYTKWNQTFLLCVWIKLHAASFVFNHRKV